MTSRGEKEMKMWREIEMKVARVADQARVCFTVNSKVPITTTMFIGTNSLQIMCCAE